MKLRAGGYWVETQIEKAKGKIEFRFPFNRALLSEIKAMDGSKWDPDKKIWSVINNKRNNIQIEYLKGNDIYAKYFEPVVKHEYKRPLFEHQKDMADAVLTYKQVLIAGEMGTGKTLAFIEAIERCDKKNIWYVGPHAGIRSVKREFKKWNCQIPVELITYNALVSMMEKGWDQAPEFIFFDESSKLKNQSSKRGQAAKEMADWMKHVHGDPYIMEGTGSPAPKDPTDWYHQVEIFAPGFIKEGTIQKFKKRLALMKLEEKPSDGTKFWKLVTWLDDENKCAKCGRSKQLHTIDVFGENGCVKFEKSVNEVDKLYKRLGGAVMVKLKKHCLDLPDKNYEEVKIKPTANMIQMKNYYIKNCVTAIEAMTLIRELSDGFQYRKVVDGKKVCPVCDGRGVEDGDVCDGCEGKKEIDNIIRVAERFNTPKDDYLKELLEEHEECGRLVIWAGFKESIYRLTDFVVSQGWIVLQITGNGYKVFGGEANSDQLLDAMDASTDQKDFEKVCIIGHPDAGGMGLTFTASPTALYYSNSFNGESRTQSEDRIHRAGMPNRNVRIIDLICLPQDKLVVDNLKAKRKLELISLGELKSLDKDN
jgi:hypothetical protein